MSHGRIPVCESQALARYLALGLQCLVQSCQLPSLSLSLTSPVLVVHLDAALGTALLANRSVAVSRLPGSLFVGRAPLGMRVSSIFHASSLVRPRLLAWSWAWACSGFGRGRGLVMDSLSFLLPFMFFCFYGPTPRGWDRQARITQLQASQVPLSVSQYPLVLHVLPSSVVRSTVRTFLFFGLSRRSTASEDCIFCGLRLTYITLLADMHG
jgi:hypothetical protein